MVSSLNFFVWNELTGVYLYFRLDSGRKSSQNRVGHFRPARWATNRQKRAKLGRWLFHLNTVCSVQIFSTHTFISLSSSPSKKLFFVLVHIVSLTRIGRRILHKTTHHPQNTVSKVRLRSQNTVTRSDERGHQKQMTITTTNHSNNWLRPANGLCPNSWKRHLLLKFGWWLGGSFIGK